MKKLILPILFILSGFLAAAESTRLEIETNQVTSTITRIKPVDLTAAQMDQFINLVNGGQKTGITSANIQRIVIVRHEQGTNIWFTAYVSKK